MDIETSERESVLVVIVDDQRQIAAALDVIVSNTVSLSIIAS